MSKAATYMKEIPKVTTIGKKLLMFKWVLKFQWNLLPIEISANDKVFVQSMKDEIFLKNSSISVQRAQNTLRNDPMIMVYISSEPAAAMGGRMIYDMYPRFVALYPTLWLTK